MVESMRGWQNGNPIHTFAGKMAEENAKFDATNPSFLERVIRSATPIVGGATAMGDMYTAAGKGDALGMGVATAQALANYGISRSPVAYAAIGAPGRTARALWANKEKIAGVLGLSALGTEADTVLAHEPEMKGSPVKQAGLPLPDKAIAEANAKAAREFQAKRNAELDLIKRGLTPAMIESLKQMGLPHK